MLPDGNVKCENGPTPPSTDECDELNYKDYGGYDGVQRVWVEVKRGFPCEVVCRSIYRGTRTLRVKENGTPCQTYGISNGECFAGLCKSVDEGCRDSYGRPLRVDMCMKCGGTNLTCHWTEGTFRTIVRNSDLNDMPIVVRIPEGATSIEIVKYGRKMNSLALVDSSNRFIINEKGWPSKEGKYKIDGITWIYKQRMNQESMTSRGPIVAPTTIRLTTKLFRQVVHYSLWLPNGKNLVSENYIDGNSINPSRVEYEPGIPLTSMDTDFNEPLQIQNKPQLPSSTTFDESLVNVQRNSNTGNSDWMTNEREPLDIKSFDKSTQIQIESHPSHIRNFNEPINIENEARPTFNVKGTKTIIIEVENEPESTLDQSGTKTLQLEDDKRPTYFDSSSIDKTLGPADNDSNIWNFVESELKKQGEDYIWELVEWQLQLSREEAIWELVEEELRSIGEDAIWRLVEDGLQRLHDKNGHKPSPTIKETLESIHPKHTTDNRIEKEPDVVVISEKGRSEIVDAVDKDREITTDKGDNSIEFRKSDGEAEDNRTRRINVSLRELPLKDNRPVRIRPNGKGRKWNKGGSNLNKRTKPKRRRRKKKGKWKPNDIYISLKPNEHCFPCIRPKDKVRQFCTSDFVSKVHVNRRKVIGNETRYDVTVLSSYRNRVRLLQREYIWMESTCRCPRVKTKRTYIMMGKMQNLSDRLTRLVITPKSYIRGFSVGFDRKIRELTRTIQCPKD